MHKHLTFVSTVNMPHEEWLARRRKSIGGSDAAAVVGLNAFVSQYSLWAEKTGKIPALTKAACKDERTAVFFKEYENSVPAPKMMVTSNLWVQLEVTFTEVWNGAGVSRSLQNLSEMIMSQINGAEYKEEFIEEPKEEEETVEFLDEEAEREAALQEE